MKLSQILKLVVISVLTVFSIVGQSNVVLADYLNSEGVGGIYRYQLWSSDDNSYYYLKIWLIAASLDSNPYSITRYFNSSREALIYFDCNYADRKLPECS